MDNIEKALNNIKNEYKNKSNISLGIRLVDENYGKIKPNHLVVLGGESAAGKSLCASYIFGNLIKENKNVIYVSLEMDFDTVISRLASQMDKLPTEYFKCIVSDEEEIEKDEQIFVNFAEKMKSLNNWEILTQLDLDDSTCKGILNACECKAKEKNWNKIDLIIIDYLQFISRENSSEDIYEHISKCILIIKKFIMSNNVPILLISSLAKNGTFSGANDIIYTAELGLMITNTKDKNIKNLDIIKNRFGKYDSVDIEFDEYLNIKENIKKTKKA